MLDLLLKLFKCINVCNSHGEHIVMAGGAFALMIMVIVSLVALLMK